jgi:hypothetical protein
VLNVRSSVVGGSPKLATIWAGGSPSAQALLHIADVPGTAEVYGRFMGGSGQNTSNSGHFGQSVHDMQIAQSRINTGDCASR